MADSKLWRLKVKGGLSLDQAQAAVADHEGTLLRVHTENGETDIYFSSSTDRRQKGDAGAAKGALSKVSLATVTKIR